MLYRTWYDPKAPGRQTRRASLGTDDVAEAKRLLAHWYAHNVTLRRAEPNDAKLADILFRYHEDHGQHKRSGANQFIQLKKCLDLCGRDYLVSEFDPPAQRRLVAALKEAGHNVEGVNRYFGSVKAALRWAVDEGLIVSHPHLVPNESVKHDDRPSRLLSVEELATLWNQAEEPYTQAFIMVLITTLCRHEAATQLTRFQCDPADGTIDLNGGRTRTKKRRPVILMPDALRPWIMAAGNYVVEKDGRPLRSCIIPFRRARQAAGLDADVSPRVIRRTMANLLRVHGVPQFQIEAWMGQNAVNTTATTHYFKPPRPDFLKDARDGIDRVVSEIGRIAVRPIVPLTLSACQLRVSV